MTSRIVLFLIPLAAACIPGRGPAQPMTGQGDAASLAEAVLLVAHPYGDREIYVDTTSFAQLTLAIPGERVDLAHLERLVGQRIRTDVGSVRAECVPRAPCRLPGNPLVVTLGSVVLSSREAVVQARYTYNLDVGGRPVLTADTYDISATRAASGGWAVRSVKKRTTHQPAQLPVT